MPIILFFKNLLRSLISLVKILLKSKFFIKQKKVSPNKSCFVLANGPSLNDDIKKYKEIIMKNDLFVLNFFLLSPHFFELKPNNYIVLDDGFFKRYKEKKFIEFNTCLRDKVNWKMTFFLPSFAKNSILAKDYLSKNPNITIQLYNYTVFNGFEKLGYSLMNKNLCMPQCQNIVAATLTKTLQLGYQNIYIFGAENNWHTGVKVNNKNQLIFKDTHLYDEKDDTEIIIPGKLHQQMLSLHKMFLGYHKVQGYAINKNTTIYNCSTNSYIDAFPRLNEQEIKEHF